MVRAPRLSDNLLDANNKPKDHKSVECIRPLMLRVKRAIFKRNLTLTTIVFNKSPELPMCCFGRNRCWLKLFKLFFLVAPGS